MKTIFASLLLVAGTAGAATVTIDGAQTYQTIEGFGVNANYRSWTNDNLKPVLDALIDQGGMTLFLVISPHASNCEGTNDNSDANVMNWTYYNSVYSGADFQHLWGMMAYLNQRGITNGLIPKFGGPGVPWMGGLSLTPGYENELAEMLASVLIYARDTQHLQFRMVSPLNEPDTMNTGIHLSGPSQYVTILHDLGQQLDTNGLSDVRFSGPQLAYTDTSWFSTIMGDAYVMSKLDHFGLHHYINASLDSTGVASFIQQSPYPDTPFWMSEFGLWCSSCVNGTSGNNTWTNAQGIVTSLVDNLGKGASAGLTFEGYDSTFGGNWSLWGLFAVDDTSAVPRTYTPRKQFYAISQISRYVRPGAQRIDVSGSTSPLTLLAFYHSALGQLTLTGINNAGSAASLSGTLTSLPSVSSLELYYTDSTSNLRDDGPVSVTSGSFVATIPANCVFTLVGTSSATGAPVIAQASLTDGGFILRGSNGVPYRNCVVLGTTNVALPQPQWTPLATNTFGPNGDFDWTNTVAPSEWQHYLRLVMTTP